MRRVLILMLLALFFGALLTACTDDGPTDLSGCISHEGDTEEEIYSEEEGCRQGTIFEHHAEGEEHGEEAEGEHAEEGEAEHSEEGVDAEHSEEGSEAESTEAEEEHTEEGAAEATAEAAE
jgi:hypothetical protein